MVHDRLQQLLDYHRQEPDDSFIVYGLALEYQKIDIDKAINYFDILLKDHANYLPTYYHAALLFQEIGDIEKSQDIFKKGMILAEQQEDAHALRELSNAYQNFLFEEDLDE